MLKNLIKSLFDFNEKELKRIRPLVDRINSLEAEIKRLSDAELQAQTALFRERVANGATLDDLLPEAFATVREAALRTLGQRHFDVQLIGGVVLHEGNIAEMKTGEGKTLAATLPVYLNALTGRGVHVVTVNDYLARRDSEWMGRIYRFLGLSVGLIVPGLEYAERKTAYAADITYGTNNEFGFDYLRDNMAISPEEIVQRQLHYAIIDEVDSILIDEARTPLIISGPGQRSADWYYRFAQVVSQLKAGEDYEVDEKAHTVTPTESGLARVEKLIGQSIYDNPEGLDLSAYLTQALKAKALMKRDRDYIVKDGEVIIVDQFTGRLMFGRRYSDGLHQAIEAKEAVKIERESQTLATITFQNYFRMYDKLAGMTGTAATEEEEFRKIYGLSVVVIPTNKPMIREDFSDAVYRTESGKFRAVVEEIVQCHQQQRPVLVGTVSIENSERLSEMLKRRGISHQVLNAKYHEKEAEIVAQAGQPGAVTIATNMAGRGTDIVLGPGVTDMGGLHIIGTERHESRRIDNQLRGRSGRQGDPGSSRFYISMEDDLMRLFGADNINAILDKLGMDDSQPIEHSLLTRAIETAQKRVEARNFDIRRHVLEYDNVMNKQREVIYEQRRKVLFGHQLKEQILELAEHEVAKLADQFAPADMTPEYWDLAGLASALEAKFLPKDYFTVRQLGQYRDPASLREHLVELIHRFYSEKEARLGDELMRSLEKVVMLRTVDSRWMAHLAAMDDLREGIGLRAYGQEDPLMAYKQEAYEMFQAMVEEIQQDVVRYVFKLEVVQQPQRQKYHEPNTAGRQPVRGGKKVGRNDPCPCGSGKKYKKCCGRNA